MPGRKTVTAEGGLQYDLLPNNDHQFYKFHHHSSFDIDTITQDGFKTHYVLLSCEEIRTKLLPNTANPRDPASGGVVSEMQRTLNSQPEKFYQYNGGITIACSEVEVNPAGQPNNTIRINFSAKDGICNGGHTYFSIQSMGAAIDPKAIVLLEILELPGTLTEPEKREIVGEIARKRNKNRSLSTGTQLNHLGHFDLFKERFTAERCYDLTLQIPAITDEDTWNDWIRKVKEVYWYEGDPVAFGTWTDETTPSRLKSSHFIRILASMDPMLFSHRTHRDGGNGSHQGTVTGDSAQSNLAKMIDEAAADPSKEIRKMAHMAPLAYDILKFRDLISHDLAHGTYPQGYRNSTLWKWFRRGKIAAAKPLRRLTVNTGLAEDTGLHLPDNAYPLITGLFRNNVWLGKNPTTTRIQYSGWIELPWETYNFSTGTAILRQIQYQKLKDLMDAGDDTGYDFIRNSAVYQQSWIDARYGMIGIPLFPSHFYDLNNQRSVYTKCEQADATHVVSYVVDASELPVSVEDIQAANVQNKTQSTDFEYYKLVQRRDLIPAAVVHLGWAFKSQI